MANFVLSENDLKVLKETIARVRQHIPRPLQDSVDPLPQAPDVYIAKAIETIPALTDDPDTGTGSWAEPGKGECEIYQVIEQVVDSPELVLTENNTRTVYNLTSESITTDKWNVIIKDKYGTWVIPFGNDNVLLCGNASTEVPPFGITAAIQPTISDSGQITYGSNRGYIPGSHINFIANGKTTIPINGDPVSGFIIGDRPVPIRIAEEFVSSPNIGDPIGPIETINPDLNNPYQCGLGLPPFTVVSTLIRTDDEGGKYILANRVPGKNVWWCKARDNWTQITGTGNEDYVLAFPCLNKNGDNCYEGVGTGTFDEPEIIIRVALLHTDRQSPNIEAGDVFRYTFAHTEAVENPSVDPPFIAFGPEYLDDPIGTIKLWVGVGTGDTDIPKGWVFHGSDDEFLRVDNTGALTTGSFAASGSSHTFREYRLIERIDNSI